MEMGTTTTMAVAAATVVLAVNGQRYEAAGVDPSTTLLEFLRTQTPIRGPKLGCGEGGCGACVVLIAEYDPATDEVNEFSASSCLTLLCSVDRCSVTTSEGIGNIRDGYHSVQQRLAGFHASQCGFCTPGMCMSIFSALVKADKEAGTGRPAPRAGFSKLTASEAERAISGNLCRCTGYRPIIDACKSFAADIDLEDLGLNCFWKKGDEDADVNRLPAYNSGSICIFPDFLKSEIKSAMEKAKGASIVVCDDGWFHPKSIQELHKLFDSNWFDENSVKIVASNTGSGVYKDPDLYDKYIDIKGIPELSVINRTSKGIEIGSVVSISKAIEVFSDGNMVFKKIANHLSKVASPFIRNTATIGGNIIMAQRLDFESDVATVLLAVGSTISIQMASKRLSLSLEEFLQQPPCDSRTLLMSIFVPDWGSDGINFETYRAAPRPFGNAVSYVNSAFLARISGYHLIEEICLAFGAYGADHATRARKVEDFLKGKSVSLPVVLEAVRLLKDTLSPSEGTPHRQYRISLAASTASVNLSAHAYWSPDPAFSSYLNYGAAFSEVEVDVLTGATTILRSDLVYDCGQSLNPAVDLGQVEGAFVQGVGFFTNEEYATNSDGMVVNDGTWTYKIPTVDTIPKQFNVEFINSARDQRRVLSSKASGEPPLLLASSVHCAMKEAIRAARKEFSVCTGPANSVTTFQMDVPATMPIVKELCGLDVVERYLESVCNAGSNTT